MRIVACLNGDRRPTAHPALPVSADQLVSDARAAVAAGATEIHIHPRDAHGAESLEPQVLTPVLEQLRAEVPEVPISVTTALSAEPDPWRRYDMIQRWGALPDSATVNLHEPGSVEVARLLIDRRVPVEAGVWTVDSTRILAATELAPYVCAVLIEPTQPTREDALNNAAAINEVLDGCDAAPPRMLHGSDDTAWPLLDAALADGHDIRMGLEDTLRGPDGADAADNAALIAMALSRVSA